MEKINIAELLKDCPKGMELDCSIYDDVKFMEVDTESDTIILLVGNKFIRRLNNYGQDDVVNFAKCVIFPKGKTTWEGFVPPIKFKNGDVVVDDSGAIFLYKQIHTYYEEPYADFYCGLSSEFRRFKIKTGEYQHCGKIDYIRLATEDEKKELFDAIKEHGYKWNEETKTLEKLIVPKFKDGDKVTIKEGDGKYYIRIGEIPQNETSSIYRGDNIIGKENGVSVYNCVEINNKYHIVMPIPLKEGQGSTYEIFIQSITQCRFKIDKPSKVYLVTGDEVGVGNDNEPILKNIKIIKDITSDFINT